MTESELITRIKQELSTDDQADLSNSNYTNAVDKAEVDCGWNLPQSTAFRIEWLEKRAIRHLMFKIMMGSTRKYRVDQYYSQQRFKNFKELIKFMDDEFELAIDENPDLFAGVNPEELFGFRVDAGFAYDSVGKDITYNEDQEVIIDP